MMAAKKKNAPDDRAPFEVAAYTIPEFCKAHKISRRTYYALKKEGLAPQEARLFGRVIITYESAARWREERTAATAATPRQPKQGRPTKYR